MVADPMNCRHEFDSCCKEIKTYKTRKIELKRFYLPGTAYFITCVTENRQKLFANEVNVQILLGVMEHYRKEYGFRISSYCILPDHFHCLVIPSGEAEISKIMKGIKGCSARVINHATGRCGKVWQHQFLDHVVRAKEDYRSHVDYVHNNPQKHGIVDEIRKYRWSSYHDYYGDQHELNSFILSQVEGCLQVDRL
jgi:putative transposase